MKSILVCDPISKSALELFDKEKDLKTGGNLFKVDVDTAITRDGLLKVIDNYEGVIVRSRTRIEKEHIERASKLKIIARAGKGVDNIDVEAAVKKGILVINSPEGNIQSAAEHTFALLLAVARKIPLTDRMLRQNKWAKKEGVGVELEGKTLGIVGLGRVGTKVANFAKAFGMKVIAHDPYVDKKIATQLGVNLVDFNTLITQADFITINVILTEETRNMFSIDVFSKMKKTAYVINTSRGEVINENDLYNALKDGMIAGAALDVFANEPLQNSPLTKLDNIVLTPHLGASTEEANLKVSVDVIQQMISYFKTGKVDSKNLVK